MIPSTRAACRQIIKQQQKRINELEEQLAQRDRRIAELEKTVERLAAQVEQLTAQVARLSKNSSTSSKSPSSDIVKPPKPPAPKGGKRHIGGQEGHPRHVRPPFTPEQLRRFETYDLHACPDCGGSLTPAAVPPRVIQQVELILNPVEVVEHRAGAFHCRHCGKIHYAPLPPAVEKCGLIGPELTGLAAYLKGVCHASFSTVHRFFRDVLKITISRGQLVKLIGKTSDAMALAHEQLRASLPGQGHLNVDETGHKELGQSLWTWCFRAELYTFFKIDPSRGSQVLIETLGSEFDGVLGCDYFSAYRKYMGDFDVDVQFCLAHLIRDTKFLTTLPDKVTAAYGQRVLEGLRQLFHIIHRRDAMDPARFQRALETARDELIAVGRRAPQRSEAQNLAERFRKHGDAYFRFITTPGIQPTNNLAEQAIRFVVLDRHVTQGTRGEPGRRRCERIWTAIATCAQQGRSVYEYTTQSITAHLNGLPAPSLLPVPALGP